VDAIEGESEGNMMITSFRNRTEFLECLGTGRNQGEKQILDPGILMDPIDPIGS